MTVLEHRCKKVAETSIVGSGEHLYRIPIYTYVKVNSHTAIMERKWRIVHRNPTGGACPSPTDFLPSQVCPCNVHFSWLDPTTLVSEIQWQLQHQAHDDLCWYASVWFNFPACTCHFCFCGRRHGAIFDFAYYREQGYFTRIDSPETTANTSNAPSGSGSGAGSNTM